MHLVGFTIEIYYDARPYERQIWNLIPLLCVNIIHLVRRTDLFKISNLV